MAWGTSSLGPSRFVCCCAPMSRSLPTFAKPRRQGFTAATPLVRPNNQQHHAFECLLYDRHWRWPPLMSSDPRAQGFRPPDKRWGARAEATVGRSERTATAVCGGRSCAMWASVTRQAALPLDGRRMGLGRVRDAGWGSAWITWHCGLHQRHSRAHAQAGRYTSNCAQATSSVTDVCQMRKA
eukprot:46357-Alexandrium_andersonii.AAC.1